MADIRLPYACKLLFQVCIAWYMRRTPHPVHPFMANILDGGVLSIMHGRSRMTIDPRIPTMSGRNPSGFHRLGRQHQARSAVRCSESRILLRTACEADFLAYGLLRRMSIIDGVGKKKSGIREIE